MKHLSHLTEQEFKKYFPNKFLGTYSNIQSIINSLDNFVGFHYAIAKYGTPDTYLLLEEDLFDVTFLRRRYPEKYDENGNYKFQESDL